MLKTEKEIDFFDLGIKYFKLKNSNEIKIMIDYISKNCTEEEVDNFLLGIASQIPCYSKMVCTKEGCINTGSLHGTCSFGISEYRNNSYFDEEGISRKYDWNGKYQDPVEGPRVLAKTKRD